MGATRIADHIGRVLGGRYRLLAPVGTGASAHVFVADDARLGRRVAVKVLHPALAADPAFLRRFEAEARAAAALNHPNVLAVYDWGDEADGPYLVTEYLAGGSLRAMLDGGRRLSPSQALMVGLEAARGLDYAHRRGLVHRDVKPANLIFDSDARLRIADFGLARALAEAAWTEPSGVALGTARYAAPEQARGLTVDGKADVYSLAIVLVEAVTGRAPFAADTTVATLMGRLERSIPVPDELGPLAEALRRAGVVDPEARSDAMAFGAGLQAVAPELPAPEPLPLAGMAALDYSLGALDDNPTEVGARSRSVASEPNETIVIPADNPPVRPATAGTVRGAGAGAGADRTSAIVIGSAGTVVGARAGSASGSGARSLPAHVPMRDSRRRRRRRQRYEDPGFLSPSAGRRRRKLPVFIAIVMVLAGIAGGAYAYVRVTVPSHEVPGVAGSTVPAATSALDGLNFDVETTPAYSDEVAEGLVISQNPLPGASLREGRTVVLVVSQGREPVDVPDLTSLSDGQAAAALAGAGLEVDADNITYENHETVPKNFILDWSPRTGQPRKGTPIALTISNGPAPRVVPSLAGATFDQARAELAAKRLEATRTDVFSNDVADGRVISTDPGAGTSVPRDSTVSVIVSKGQPVVPNLNGKTKAQAEAALTEAGLRAAVFGPGGTVFRTSPDAGTRVQAGSLVTVYIG